jgi:hypothetical protein
MNCEKIESILSELKVNARGSIRGKNRVIDKLHSEHLKERDEMLMDIRVYVAKLSNHPTKESFKAIDDFIYRRTITP